MKVIAFGRSIQGTGANRRLRSFDKTPAIIYGVGAEPKLIEPDRNTLYHALKKGALHSSVLDIEVAGRIEKALLRDFQLHLSKQLVLRADFQRASAKGETHVKVPLHFLNQGTVSGVELSHGIVNHTLNNVETSCLSADLPKFIEMDLGTLEIGQVLYIVSLGLSKDVTVLTHGGDGSPTIANTSVPANEKSVTAEEGVAAADKDKPAT